MNSTTESSVAGVLGIPPRRPSYTRPFWHRDAPLIAIDHFDHGYASLRQAFPTSWEHLARVKTLLDGIAMLDMPCSMPAALHLKHITPLLMTAADELIRFANAGEAADDADLCDQAQTMAVRMIDYARTGEWSEVILHPPQLNRPWLYCGPLNTWPMHATHMPMSLIVTSPRPDLQIEVDKVDESIDTVRDTVADALGGPVQRVLAEQPSMQLVDLLLVGGESSTGHKNFAHFFPLEAPASTVDGETFTVVFGNVHEQRLRRCSLRLLSHYLGHSLTTSDSDVLRASLLWFRCHDLGHFWRLKSINREGEVPSSLGKFELGVLEETHADILGLISAATLLPANLLGMAFAGEMLRYLSRDYRNFADSAAAVLTVGWLREHSVTFDLDDPDWVTAALPPLSQLATIVHHVLWARDHDGVDILRAAVRAGAEWQTRIADLFTFVPTDLDYIFG